MKRFKQYWLGVTVLLLSACSGTTNLQLNSAATSDKSQVCTDVLAYGIELAVQFPTGSSPNLNLLEVTVSDGTYVANWTGAAAGSSDGIQPYGWQGQTYSVGAAPERPGTYDITVSYPGYTSVQLSGISVASDGCHVQTQKATATLAP